MKRRRLWNSGDKFSVRLVNVRPYLRLRPLKKGDGSGTGVLYQTGERLLVGMSKSDCCGGTPGLCPTSGERRW